MSRWHCRLVAAAGLALALTLDGSGPAHAQPGRGILVLTVSESLDPVSPGGDVAYTISVKNTGSIRAKLVLVTMSLAPGTSYVKCTTTPAVPLQPCALVGNAAVSKFQSIPARGTVKVVVTLKMPTPQELRQVSFNISGAGDQADDSSITVTTTVLGSTAPATFLPSGRQVTLVCETVLNDTAFNTDHTLRLDGSLGCSGDKAFGLRMAANNRTLDLSDKKIVGATSGLKAKGSAGVVVALDRVNVTIRGGSIKGTAGIEYFDWCVFDEGGNDGLVIDTIRCFRGRSAGIDLLSSNVTITKVLVDKAVATSKTTFEPPGGVGIRVTGDNVVVKDSTVRRSGTYGIWATGADTDGNGTAITIEGSAGAGTPVMRIESNEGVGLLADGHRLHVKDVKITGDGMEEGANSTTGVVVESTATETLLDGVQVKQFGANGFLVAGPGTRVTNSRVEEVAADGFVITGDAVVIQNNESRAGRHGYVLSGADIQAETNLAEEVGGDGFVVTGTRVSLANSTAKEGIGHGFVVEGVEARLETNVAELNNGDGFHIALASTGSLYKGNGTKASGMIGFQVLGPGNRFSTNSAENSAGLEWSIGPNNKNNGSNKAGSMTCRFVSFSPLTQTCP